jgi:hypothetical protein
MEKSKERPKDLSGVLLIPTAATREVFLGPGKYGSRPPIFFQVGGPAVVSPRWAEGADIFYPGAVEDILRAGLVLAAEDENCDEGIARAERVRLQTIGRQLRVGWEGGYNIVVTQGIMGTKGENWEGNPLTSAYSLARQLKMEGLADYVLIDRQGFEWPDLGRP